MLFSSNRELLSASFLLLSEANSHPALFLSASYINKLEDLPETSQPTWILAASLHVYRLLL